MSDTVHKNYSGTIILKCANCGGHLEVDNDNDIAKCPFCGTYKLLVENDEVVRERIINKTLQDVASEKIQADREVELTRLKLQAQEEMEKRLGKIRRSPLTVIVALLTIGSLFAAIDTFLSDYWISAGIMVFQTLLFFISWLMRMSLIKGARIHLHTLASMVAILLIIPFIMFIGVLHRSYDKYVWPQNNLTAMLPKPKSEYGEIVKDIADQLIIKVGKVKDDDYNSYVEECIASGFSLRIERSEYEYRSFKAYDESGAELELIFFPHLNEMQISIMSFKEFYELTWPERGLFALLPEPEATMGIINTEDEDSINVLIADTPVTEFNKYVDACIEAGFAEDIFKTEEGFSAENIDGVNIIINYYVSDVIEILVYIP